MEMEDSKSVLIIAPSDRKFRVDIKSNSSQSDLELIKISFEDICLKDFALKQIVDSSDSHFIFKKFDPLFKCEVEITDKDVIEHGCVLHVTIISSVLANLSKLPGTSSANDNETLSKTEETILPITENQASTSKPSLNTQPANQNMQSIQSFITGCLPTLSNSTIKSVMKILVESGVQAVDDLKEIDPEKQFNGVLKVIHARKLKEAIKLASKNDFTNLKNDTPEKKRSGSVPVLRSVSTLTSQRHQKSLRLKDRKAVGQILKSMKALRYNVDELRRETTANKNLLEEIVSKSNNLRNLTIQQNENVEDFFPLHNMEAVLNMEEKLQDFNFKAALVQHLGKIGGVEVKGTVNNIMRALLKKDVAVLFSGSGRLKKYNFSSLRLCPIVYKAVKHHITSATDAEIKLRISRFLATSSDREGGRRQRDLLRSLRNRSAPESVDVSLNNPSSSESLESPLLIHLKEEK